MKKEEFIKTINILTKIDDTITKLYDIGVDIISSPLCDYGIIADILWTYIYGEEGMDIINWWLYENVDKIITINGEDIDVTKVEDLYDFLNKYYG